MLGRLPRLQTIAGLRVLPRRPGRVLEVPASI